MQLKYANVLLNVISYYKRRRLGLVMGCVVCICTLHVLFGGALFDDFCY